jgi:hypothetical protein
LHKINIGVSVTSLPQVSAIKMMCTSPKAPARTHYMFQMVEWLGQRQRHWKSHWMHWFWRFQTS